MEKSTKMSRKYNEFITLAEISRAKFVINVNKLYFFNLVCRVAIYLDDNVGNSLTFEREHEVIAPETK